MTENKPNQENEYSTLSVVKVDIKPPSLYKVILVNDDYTPMDFVVEVLVSIFRMNKSFATRVMLDVHTKGAGVCGIYTYEIAETFVAQVTKMAKQHQHPLLCSMEEDQNEILWQGLLMLSSELEFCLNEAFHRAREKRHEFITIEHLLLSLLDIPDVIKILKN